jgi:hypothetical protein
MAGMGHDHFGAGRRHFVGGYGYGLGCPYYPYDLSYNSDPYCTY